MKGTVAWPEAGKSWDNDPWEEGSAPGAGSMNMQDTAPPGRAALAALFLCPLSCQDDGSHFRVQALVAGQDSRDYAAPASVAVCMHISR